MSDSLPKFNGKLIDGASIGVGTLSLYFENGEMVTVSSEGNDDINVEFGTYHRPVDSVIAVLREEIRSLGEERLKEIAKRIVEEYDA